jgi:hypothetical protein
MVNMVSLIKHEVSNISKIQTKKLIFSPMCLLRAAKKHAKLVAMSTDEHEEIDDGPDEDEADLNSKEGWVGASRPAAKPAPPPVADRAGRPKLYTTVAVKAGDVTCVSRSRSNSIALI